MINKYIIILLISLLVFWSLIIFRKKKQILKQYALYKIVPISDFDKINKNDCIKKSKLDEKSGFIHASYGKQQVEKIMEKFFKQDKELLVLELNIETLNKNGTIVKLESNKPGGAIYPHLYGTQKIPLNAIKKIIHIN